MALRTAPLPEANRFRLVFLAPVLALIALLCWALASPVGSSPDDDFHLPSIWCGLGDRPSVCENVAERKDSRLVPVGVAEASDCFARKSNQDAACQWRVLNSRSETATDRVNASGLYPPVFYAVMSVFVSPNVAVSAVVMRLVNAIILVGITTALYVLLPRRRRSTLLWAWAVTLVPLGMFLVASNNPSSWAIISGGSLWISLVGYFESEGRRKIGLGIVAVLAAVLGAGARADAAVFAVLAVIVAMVMTARKERRYWISAALPIAIVIVAILLYFTATQVGSAAQGLRQNTGGGGGVLGLVGLNLLNMPGLWAGVFGTWSLGWFDTPLPSLVWVFSLSAFIAAGFVGLASLSTRKLLALTGIVVALWVIPTYLLVKSGELVGVDVQPRYMLPLIVMLAGVALLMVGRGAYRVSRFQTYLVVGLLAISNSVALHFNLRRYVSGDADTNWLLDPKGGWWWDLPIGPLLVWVLGSVTFGALVFVLLRDSVSSLNRLEPPRNTAPVLVPGTEATES